jgi:hypothetical protein
MNNYKKLVEDYPELFDCGISNAPFPMFGFECGIGWYRIIENACRVICSNYNNAKWLLGITETQIADYKEYTERRNKYSEQKMTEEEVLNELNLERSKRIEDIQKEKDSLPKVMQIKEKFGTMRFYLGNCNEVHNAITQYAENMSCTTCEECGNVGKNYRMRWFQTLCPQHAIEKYGKEALDEYETMAPNRF